MDRRPQHRTLIGRSAPYPPNALAPLFWFQFTNSAAVVSPVGCRALTDIPLLSHPLVQSMAHQMNICQRWSFLSFLIHGIALKVPSGRQFTCNHLNKGVIMLSFMGSPILSVTCFAAVQSPPGMIKREGVEEIEENVCLRWWTCL